MQHTSLFLFRAPRSACIAEKVHDFSYKQVHEPYIAELRSCSAGREVARQPCGFYNAHNTEIHKQNAILRVRDPDSSNAPS